MLIPDGTDGWRLHFVICFEFIILVRRDQIPRLGWETSPGLLYISCSPFGFFFCLNTLISEANSLAASLPFSVIAIVSQPCTRWWATSVCIDLL